MSLLSIDISGFKSGVQQKNKKPFLLTQDAFSELENAYVWREEVKKREGIKLIGRLRRVFDDASLGNSGASQWNFNIFSTLVPAVVPEDNATIEPDSVIIYLNATVNTGAVTGYTNASDAEVLAPANGLSNGDRVTISGVVVEPDSGPNNVNGEWVITEAFANSFKLGVDSHSWGTYLSGGTWTHVTQGAGVIFIDQGDGTLTSVTANNIGTINYLTGDVSLFHTAGVGVSVLVDFAYYPNLPVMGILTREIPATNDEQTIWFDTKYAYKHDGSDFQEFLPGFTWNGTDSDFFWGTNYRGSDAQTRLFFVTNFVLSSGSPMRYVTASGSTWETFKPVIGGTTQTNVLSTTLAAGSGTFGPAFLTDLPIVEGTVVITVSRNDGTSDIIFRDTPKDGTLVSSGLNSGIINYATGQIDLTFNPVLPGSATWTVTAVYSQGGTFLISARILIPYYGRLVALNTWEGQSEATSVNIYNRARFSQIGSPVQQDAWRSDVFGKGGFVDAPVNENIISATFYKNTLIVYFERSTWRLQYLGEYGIPFIWERISSDFGSESTFSPVLFDSGVLAVGDKAIIASSGGDVQRIDLDIPDIVYQFKNADNGTKRVYGIRDFKKEVVYWTFPNYPTMYTGQYFPNRTLLFNYRNNTFAFFRNTVTCYGNFQYPANITWDRLDIFWDNENVFWNDEAQAQMPLIASGNQQGFCHYYGYDDVENNSDSTIDAIDQESLYVSNVTIDATGVIIESFDHNLVSEEFIYLTGLIYMNITNPLNPLIPPVGSTTLNNFIYKVQFVDKDNIRLFLWDPATQAFYANFTVTNVGSYVGGGVMALFPRILIQTKDFNPVKEVGQNIKTSYIDFLFDASSPSPINVQLQMNTTPNARSNMDASGKGNVNIGNLNVETANSKTGYITNVIQNVSPTVIITSKNHGLLTGDQVSPENVGGSTQLNGKNYVITFLTTDTFSVQEAGISSYTVGGYWKQSNQEYFTLSAQYAWHRFFATAYGQYLALVLTYTDEQMSQISTHRQNFVLNAMKIWYRPGGKNIFGK